MQFFLREFIESDTIIISEVYQKSKQIVDWYTNAHPHSRDYIRLYFHSSA